MKSFDVTPAFEAEVRTLYTGGVPVHQIAKRLKAPVALVVTTKNRLRLHRDPMACGAAAPVTPRPEGGFHGNGRVWTAMEDDELVRLHATDMTLSAIAAHFGVGIAAVNRRANVLGLSSRRPDILTPNLVSAGEFIAGATNVKESATAASANDFWTPSKDAELTRLYGVGVTTEDLAGRFRCAGYLVRDRIDHLGLVRGQARSCIPQADPKPAAPAPAPAPAPASSRIPEANVTRDAIHAFTRDAQGYEVAASHHGVDVSLKLRLDEVSGIDEALDRAVTSLRTRVVTERIFAGAPCDPADVSAAILAAQATGEIPDALVLAAFKAGLMSIGQTAVVRPTRTHGGFWSPERDAKLEAMVKAGRTQKEIATEIGTTMGQVANRKMALGLRTTDYLPDGDWRVSATRKREAALGIRKQAAGKDGVRSRGARWTKEEVEAVRRMTLEGKSAAEIGKAFGVGDAAIRKLRTNKGISGLSPTTTRTWKPSHDDTLRRMWSEGAAMPLICRTLGFANTTVRDHVARLGLPTRMWDAKAGRSVLSHAA